MGGDFRGPMSEGAMTLLGESFNDNDDGESVSAELRGETTSNADLLGCDEKFGYISADDDLGYISDVLG